MNSRMRPFREVPSSRKKITFVEPDRIPGTTKIRTYTANGSLYSKESSMEKLIKRAKLCADKSEA